MNTGNERHFYGTAIAEPGTKILGLSPVKIFRQNNDGLAGIRREIDLRVAEVQLGWSIRDRINRRRVSLLTMANLGKLLDRARPL